MPVIKYIKDKYPHCIIHLWIPDYYLDFAKNLLPNTIIKPFSKAAKEYNPTSLGRKTSSLQHTNMKTHLVDNAFHILVDKAVEIEYKNYLPLNLNKISITKFSLPEKYVVVATGFTAEVREFPPIAVNSVVDYIIKKGYTPVFLGSTVTKIGVDKVSNHHSPDILGNFNKEIDYSKGIDLRNKTSLLESGKIIAGAKTIVGVDCGLLHVAGCTNIPIVGAFTTVEPKFRMPYRGNELGKDFYPIVPDESLECRFCQTNWEFLYEHDYRTCYYKEQKLDTEIQCVKQITTIKFINELEKIL